MRVIVGIPARMGSSRFPGKPLKKILNKSMLEHCYQRCKLSNLVTDLFIATCDEEIRQHANQFNANVIMTEKSISRPGLRVAVAADNLKLSDNDIVVVVQGDEPLVNPKMIDLAIEPLLNSDDVFVSNLCAQIETSEMNDPGEIKVVTDLNMNALYMSRSSIPSIVHQEKKTIWWKQVCIMPFRWHFMKKFNHELEPTPLELQESIEMLRAIQYGYKVKMVESKYTTKSVDTDEDRLAAEKIMINDKVYKQYKDS